MREKLRDKSRDELAAALNAIGIKAEMAERKRLEEKIQKSWYKRSLGIIDISEGPIRWINVVKKDGGKDSPPRWWIVLCIPDEKPISGHQEINIKTVRKKTFPLFGKVTDVTWKGRDHRTGLVDFLSNDQAVKELATKIGNLKIRSCTEEFQGWTLQVDRRFEPTSQDWKTLQQIADYLLTSPRSL